MRFNFVITLCLCFCIGVFGKRSKIIGGTNADIVDFPHSASLKRISTDEHICTGSIISHYHILTAAHCVEESFVAKDDLQILIGVSNRSSPAATKLHPENIFINPEYMEEIDDDNPISGDIAIVKVIEKIIFNIFQKQINLPTRDIRFNFIASISGWGTQNFETGCDSDILQKTWLRIINNKQCSKFGLVSPFVDDFCAFQREGVGPCIGDSGSALSYNNIVVGVASLSVTCGSGEPDIFVNVYYHQRFIKDILSL